MAHEHKRAKLSATGEDGAARPTGRAPGVQPREGPSQQAAARQGSGDAEQGQLTRKQKARLRTQNPSPDFVRRIHIAAKADDTNAACAVYDEMLAAGFKPNAQVFNTLIHMCVGGWAWESHARQAALERRRRQQQQQHAASDGVNGDSGSAAGAGAGEGGSAGAGGEADPDGLLTCLIPRPAYGAHQHGVLANIEEALPAASAPAPAISRDELLVRADQIWEHMLRAGVEPEEATYMHMARGAAIRQDAEAAFALALQVVATTTATGCGAGSGAGRRRPLLPRLRDFQPALVAYALVGDAEGALRVDAAIAELKLDMSEAEFALLLEAVARGGTYQQLASVLGRMRDELNQLQPTTLSVVRTFFSSDRAAAAFAPGTPLAGRGTGWRVQSVEVDAQGGCEAAGESVGLVDMDDEQWQAFGDAIASLAAKQEKRQDAFAQFIAWHDRHGPFDVLIDAANVALCGQNREGGGFSMDQVVAMYTAVEKQQPNAKILVVMHVRRMHDIQQSFPQHLAWLEGLKAARRFYHTPAGSNDDWYWLWASVAARSRGLLVSNDELRDHIWALLRPRHFLKWKERHVARYSFTGDDYLTPVLRYPSPFTPCVQQLSNGTWMLPGTDGRWLCARPVT